MKRRVLHHATLDEFTGRDRSGSTACNLPLWHKHDGTPRDRWLEATHYAPETTCKNCLRVLYGAGAF